MAHGAELIAQVKAREGYRLPGSIEVYVTKNVTENGTQKQVRLNAETDYQWNLETGTVTIPAAQTVGPITIKVTAKKQQHISATVPMYVCMYGYGGNGKVVTPSDESYGITNKSDCAVQVVSVQATHTDWQLSQTADQLKAGELYLQLKGQTVTEKKATLTGTDWLIRKPSAGNTTAFTSIPVRAADSGGSVNEEGESRACTVTYTLEAGGRMSGDGTSKRGKIWIAAGVLLLLILAGILIWYLTVGRKDGYNDKDFFDPAAVTGILPNMSEEEIQARLNDTVEEGMLNISIASDIGFSDSSAKGQADIYNIEGNRYIFKVDITLEDTGESVYQSGGIGPGQYIQFITLDQKLKDGVYPAVATFTAYTQEEHQIVGSAAAKVTLYIGE